MIVKKKVYFDMDGILSDWVARFEEEFDVSYEEYNNNPKSYLGIKRQIAQIPDFYENMNHMKWVCVLNDLVELGVDVEILTSVGRLNVPSVIAQKKQFLINNALGSVPFNYTFSSKEKAYFANENTILIDDREKSLIPFAESGGIAIDANDVNARAMLYNLVK